MSAVGMNVTVKYDAGIRMGFSSNGSVRQGKSEPRGSDDVRPMGTALRW